MLFFQLLLLSFSLALDALSVSVAAGVEVKEAKLKDGIRIALFFGGFQALMPVIGWFVGSLVNAFVTIYAPWIAFILLAAIGLRMIKVANASKEEKKRDILASKTLVLLAIATSIDALVVGISLGLLQTPLLVSAGFIGVVTFALCLPAFLFGSKISKYFKGNIEVIGGIALILIGLKILLSSF